MTVSLRIHPTIGFARVGNSMDYYIEPQTIAAMPQPGQTLTGGLPIKAGTDNTPISSSDIRDSQGRLKRQGARFKIYQYPQQNNPSYPAPQAQEVTIGSKVDGKCVTDIIWTVHLANKKANCWEMDESANLGIILYQDGKTPPLRNPSFNQTDNPADTVRLQKLVIDAGPRTISTNKRQAAQFNPNIQASYWDQHTNAVIPLPDYPQSYPATAGNDDPNTRIDYLGEIQTETNGRLVVLGGFGKACGFDQQGNADPNAKLDMDVDNNNWLDDTADGPVTAVLLFDDGSYQALENSAWVVSTDPAYAPQTLNVVSLWDDIYTTWVEAFNLNPGLYQNNAYNPEYVPDFAQDIQPILRAASMQMWNTNLPDSAIKSHRQIDKLTKDKPQFDIMSFMRKPSADENNHLEDGSPMMPLSLGDANKSFLTLSNSQYFLMQQWAKGLCSTSAPSMTTPLNEGEALDRAVLMNCLGGRFSPGIDLTFIVRDTKLYNSDWQNPNIGPFRINRQPLNYALATKGSPFLGVGYVPLRSHPVQPGDLCKFMAIPWHTDYNSCATHTPAPNPGGVITESNIYGGNINTSLFWSWPAQRPVAVYTYEDVAKRNDNTLPLQRYSVRGQGTSASGQQLTFDAQGKLNNSPASNVGRYQDRHGILNNWQNIGVVIQGAAIDGYPAHLDPNYYLEVQSGFSQDDSNLVMPWDNTVTDPVYPPKK
ncbi:LodA/GoxA family CTQ-dependent oxidase [Shewanella algae]|uniref:LodA/GoxA family CTQ-dependent oxidase n=1 Tax=Shewanella algae TaxID=38313 RepID=UPI001AAD3193|nr:LodA/GoxA family CTQ-dependent oxidase [Shewanella algae]MBO2601093.1 LodA/GoxA family CTQ-dependent oxidase [Shewanella algae]